MTPTDFPDANCHFTAPAGLAETQVMTIPGFMGIAEGGSVDGSRICVVAWTPTPAELELIQQGKPIFISFIGGIPPHFPCMSFEEATHPA